MNKLIILLLLSTTFSFGQETKYHNPNLDLTIGKQYYLFGDNVKFREFPNTNSDIIEILKIGTEIQIINKSGESIFYNGIESPFYEVKYNNNVGYILGNLISLEKKESNNYNYLFTYKKNGEIYSIITRCLNQNNEFTETTSELTTYEFSIELSDNKGVDGIENILFINYLAEACGIDGGGIYYFKIQNRLKKVFEITQVSDGGVYWLSEDLYFPNDEKGVKGKIVYQKELGVYEDEETNWVEIKKTSRELEWKNDEIFPKLETEK